jgi:O-antigen/teichoic acid export membrane protein
MLGSMMKSKTNVGVYAAAVNIAQMWYFVPSAIQVSFKSLVMEHKAHGDKEKYEYHMIGLYSVTTYISVAFAIGISIFSPLIVHILYGKAYIPAASILTISIWGGVFAMLGTARSIWLVTENLQRYCIIYASTGCVTNIVLNLFLIPHYGAYGAAVATVITQYFNIMFFFKKTKPTFNMMIRALAPKYLIDNGQKL